MWSELDATAAIRIAESPADCVDADLFVPSVTVDDAIADAPRPELAIRELPAVRRHGVDVDAVYVVRPDLPLVEASFLDNGPGIPEESRENIFDLFYTTKPEGSGYGLGLSECYSVVKRNDGTLSVEGLSPEDISDYNTRVVLRLPTKRS